MTAHNAKSYEVIVSNIGTVYRGSSRTEATRLFREYVALSKQGAGRAGGESVTLMEDGEPIRERQSTLRG